MTFRTERVTLPLEFGRAASTLIMVHMQEILDQGNNAKIIQEEHDVKASSPGLTPESVGCQQVWSL